MARDDAYKELISSQIPALQVLINLGWEYITRDEALALREGRARHVVLTDVLRDWLRANNRVRYKGRDLAFSEGNIREAVNRLVDVPVQGLIVTNELVYELLTLGMSLPQTVDGDKKSYSLRYIDWEHPENNVYHVTEEFRVEGTHETRRPDVVLFVNGIPLVVMECKRPGVGVGEAVSQMLRNQGAGEIPRLFIYSQVLMAVSANQALYGTTGTAEKFWAMWREDGDEADQVAVVGEVVNRPLAESVADKLYGAQAYPGRVRRHFAELGQRVPTAQDRAIWAILRPVRLLELVYQYLVYDGGIKKIARYQQYFAVRETMGRVVHLNAQGSRTGGVIWHTTGSGKSLTMVMLAKALSLHPAVKNPKVVLVTDRVNLDDQIYRTFKACGKKVVQANDGKHLVRLVTGALRQGEDAGDVITTVINKFEEAARQKVRDDNPNVFVLVDESHRSQYGAMHAKMTRVFPNACYIGFTGTPLTKKEKSTAEKFGSFIHSYPMRQAVQDGAVVPLLYEGRMIAQEVDKTQLEKWFERHTRHLTDEAKADLKRKFSRSEVVNATALRIQEVAWNIAEHYQKHWQGTGYKAMLATQSKAVAIQYWELLRDELNVALLVSPPDTREGHREVDSLDLPVVQTFWKRMMDHYGGEDAYNREIKRSFSQADGIEILIVVDKLLTGFDEPRNTVLYVDKSLREHTLLQAIARVNRLFEGKSFGYIIDYRGVLGELNEAMDLYDALAEFDAEDVRGTIEDVAGQIERLPDVHSAVWSTFAAVDNTHDMELMEQHLAPEDRRDLFYERLTEFAGLLKVALSSATFYEITPEKRINTYKRDLRFFHQLRQSVKQRYAEAVDYQEYEAKIRKLLDDHVRAVGVEMLTEMVNIFDVEKFDAEVAKVEGTAAKADTIAHRMKQTITENMDKDPATYRRFSEMIEEVITAYREGRLDDLAYLEKSEEIMQKMRDGFIEDQPERLRSSKHAPAYFAMLQETLPENILQDVLVNGALQVEQIIERHKATDWATNHDIQNNIKRDVDILLFDLLRGQEFSLTRPETEMLIEQIISIAKAQNV